MDINRTWDSPAAIKIISLACSLSFSMKEAGEGDYF
jgi:hypothetical protein